MGQVERVISPRVCLPGLYWNGEILACETVQIVELVYMEGGGLQRQNTSLEKINVTGTFFSAGGSGCVLTERGLPPRALAFLSSSQRLAYSRGALGDRTTARIYYNYALGMWDTRREKKSVQFAREQERVGWGMQFSD